MKAFSLASMAGRMALALILSSHGAWAVAQAIVRDTEPNNTPEAFQRIEGPVRILGSMSGGDQDGFLWKVSESQALQPWTFTLQGIPGALTIIDILQLQYGDDGKTLTGTKKFFTLGSRDGTRPAVLSGLLFEPGEYVLGFARAGGGGSRPAMMSGAFSNVGQTFSETADVPSAADTPAPPQVIPQDAPNADNDAPLPANSYRLDITAGRPLSMSRSPAAGTPPDKSPAIRPNRAMAMLAPAVESWYRFSLNEQEAQQRWDLQFGTTVGTTADIRLQDQSGTALASIRLDAQGQGRLQDLSLPKGDYFLRVDSQEGVLHTISLNAAGLKVEGEEAEPNNRWALANRVDLFEGVQGSFQAERDQDFYQFTLTEAQADQRLALEVEVETADEQRYQVCLLDADGKTISCRDAQGAWSHSGLSLQAGQYGVKLESRHAGMRYRLRLRGDGKLDAGLEAEPNDTAAWASTILLGKRIRGTFDTKDDVDFYRIDVEGQPQMWRFQANGDGLYEIGYHDARGRRVQNVRARSGQNRLMLDRLYLAPGTHYVSLRGRDKGQYTLLSRAQGLPDPNAETEPNDNERHMLPLHIGQTRSGGFHDASDTDRYHFHLTNHDHIRLGFQAPLEKDVKMQASLAWEGQVLNELTLTSRQEGAFEGVYPPGSYVVILSTNQATESDYRLSLARLPRHGCGIDCEPNGNAAFSNPLPADGRIQGRADPIPRGDTDWYTLPVRDQDTVWHFATDSKATLRIHVEQQDKAQTLKRAAADQAYTFTVPAQTAAYLDVQATETYAIQALPDGQDMAPADTADLSTLSLAIELPVRHVAAHARLGQRLTATVQLRNAGQHPLDLQLSAVASDLGWALTLPEPSIHIPAGEQRAAALNIQVPDDARALPVQLSVRADHASGGYAHADAQVEVSAEAPLTQADYHWPVPAALRGGLNLASVALGASVLTEGKTGLYRHTEHLIDGAVGPTRGFELRKRRLPYDASVTVKLAGDGRLPITGFALHPVSHMGAPQSPQHFSVALSDDGTQFETVLRDRMAPVRREQYYVLPQARPARYARLTIHQNHRGQWGGDTSLGEWQVIATPGAPLAEGQAFNLADPRHGGHVVHALPTDPRGNPNTHWIDPDINTFWNGGVIDPRAGQEVSWVLGFHEQRAARIDRLVWGKIRGAKKHLIEQVDVQISLDSPVGPWTSIGQLQPQPDSDVEWRPASPVWARYLRFVIPAAKHNRDLSVPTAVHVYETPPDAHYRSILGLWGYARSQASYEAMHPAQIPPTLDTQATHTAPETPQDLTAGQAVEGLVQLGAQEHWYRLVMPENTNQLDLRLSDPHYLKAAVAVQTAAGDPLPLSVVLEEGNTRHWTVDAEPGAELRIKVFEPRRNVIFTWDTSGSVSPFIDQIYNAIQTYARGLHPERDLANLLPFDGALQLRDWVGDPYLMMQAINEHQSTDSSSAEATLATASRALAKRSGSRAIVLITDAATPTYRALWPALEEGRPQIMAIALSSAGNMIPNPTAEKRLMMHWSQVNGGHYSFAHDVNDMALAFERTSVLLRQPAAYRLQADTAFVTPPAAGALRVVAPPPTAKSKAGTAARPATAIILDASGSMLQRLDGERRIEIAKRGLIQAVSQQIPAGTAVSLRVFGHKEANTCRSDLEIPLQPLNVASARQVISKIQAKNLARTPIADSLSLVRQDLAKAKGPRTIVLVTDGEETCDGDPEAVIRALIADGYDVRLNIIGFALDDPILETIFGEWARLGGGQYYSAADKQSFDEAVGQALKLNYTVLDSQGQSVAQGQVDGEPVSLPPGAYQIQIETVPALLLKHVQIESEQTTTLEAKAP